MELPLDGAGIGDLLGVPFAWAILLPPELGCARVEEIGGTGSHHSIVAAEIGWMERPGG